MNYSQLYFIMFNAASDALELIDNGNEKAAGELLIRAQQKCEEIYISHDERKEQTE